jgi:simple sugar transport system permease protein
MTAYTERAKGSALADFVAEHAQVLSIALFFLACLIFFGLMTPTFLTTGNILNVIRQAAPILIVAVAMTLVITTAGIDLSVGSLVALVNAVAAILMAQGMDWPLAVVLMLAMGGLIGAMQGWFIAYQGIPAFIVTLAGLSILRGFALYLTEGYSIPIQNAPGFFWLGRGTLAGIPVPALISILVAILGFVVMLRTRYGRQVVAVGSNMEAARRVGMPARRIVASVYVVSGWPAPSRGFCWRPGSARGRRTPPLGSNFR